MIKIDKKNMELALLSSFAIGFFVREFIAKIQEIKLEEQLDEYKYLLYREKAKVRDLKPKPFDPAPPRLQLIEDQYHYVVDLDELPQLPITGTGWEVPYADALNQAISQKLITAPGKYGIVVHHDTNWWQVYQINEPSTK